MQKKKVTEKALLLRRYCRNECSNFELSRLIHLAATIAGQKLWGKINASARLQGISFDNQAISLVSGLFAGGDTNSHLVKALEGFLDSDDTVLFLRFQSVVRTFAEQELFHRWHESDPVSARLWRNLMRILRCDPGIDIFPCDRPEWVCLSGLNDLRNDTAMIVEKKVAGIIGGLQKAKYSFTDLIKAVLAEIAEDPDCRSAIKIQILFSAFREVADLALREEAEVASTKYRPDPYLKMAIDKSIKATDCELEKRLENYSNAGKLKQNELISFKKALIDILEDCCDGGPAQSYYRYLSVHWPELKQEEYRNVFRARFEYLSEFVIDNFLDCLKAELNE